MYHDMCKKQSMKKSSIDYFNEAEVLNFYFLFPYFPTYAVTGHFTHYGWSIF